mgnify:FL=1
MPTYEYECKCGKTITKVCKISEHKIKVRCSCGKMAKQIIVGGFLHRDANIPWMRDAIKTLQPDSEPKVETRQGWKRYMKDHHLACIG